MRKLALVVSMVAVMSMSLVGCGSKAPAYVDGTYEGTGKGEIEDITVSVEVKDGKIASVDVVDHGETDGISDEAIAEIPKAIVEKNSTEVDAITNATGTSNGIKEAVANALEGKTE